MDLGGFCFLFTSLYLEAGFPNIAQFLLIITQLKPRPELRGAQPNGHGGDKGQGVRANKK